MFGYIRASKPELRIKEYEMYKAVYCSLCRRLGKSYGLLSRLTLSYDFTFLALLNMSLREGCDPVHRRRCTFNPLKKCYYCKEDAPLLMPSAAAIIMLYYKIRDNIRDETGLKKLLYVLLRPVFSRAHKKAADDFPEIEKIIAAYIDEQDETETAGCRELDRAADPTAKALAALFSLCSEDSSEGRILERLGYCLGRYIYLLDAACDLSEDVKHGAYNVLSFEAQGNLREYAAERVTPQLYTAVSEAGKAFELLNMKKYKPILGNIIYLGLEDTFKKELSR